MLRSLRAKPLSRRGARGTLDGAVEAGDRFTDEVLRRGAWFPENLRGEGTLDGRLEVTDRFTNEGRRYGAGFAEGLRSESTLFGMVEVTDRVTDEAHHALE